MLFNKTGQIRYRLLNPFQVICCGVPKEWNMTLYLFQANDAKNETNKSCLMAYAELWLAFQERRK